MRLSECWLIDATILPCPSCCSIVLLLCLTQFIFFLSFSSSVHIIVFIRCSCCWLNLLTCSIFKMRVWFFLWNLYWFVDTVPNIFAFFLIYLFLTYCTKPFQVTPSAATGLLSMLNATYKSKQRSVFYKSTWSLSATEVLFSFCFRSDEHGHTFSF